jgi:pyruvate ferredoxin oxidoreductase beta subunit
VSVSKIRRKVPVEDYLRLQTRYAHLFKTPDGAATVARLQRMADRNIARFGLLDSETSSPGRAGISIAGKECS